MTTLRSGIVAPAASAARVAPPATAQAVIQSSDPSLSTTIVIAPPTLLQQAALFAQQSQDLVNAREHQEALAQQHLLITAITKLQPAWKPLPMGPYPPATDNTGFPRTGDPSLIISASKVNADQLAEPARFAQGLSDQAAARRPQLTGMFWIGLACLGVGIYVYKKR